MNYNLFKNILDNIKKDFNGDLPRLNLFGGEPLTHPDFKDIFLTAHQQGFPLRLYTNGDLLRENIHFISNLKDLNLEIMIGLHNNNFEALKKNINTLKKLTIPVDITCPTIFLSLNKLSFREIIKQFQNSELRTLIFGHSVTIQKNQEIFTSAFYEELVDINKYYQKNPKIKFFPQIENSNLLKFYKDPTYPAKPRCLNNFFCPIVQPNGEIFFCNRYPQAVGSLDKQTLQDIWNNSLYKKLREKTFHQDFHQECRNCCWGIYY
jgi:radical SAM protein with 4Fe4S-binding SPASM domain